MYNNYGYGYHSMMGYWGFGDIIGHIIGLVIMVAVIVWLVRMIFGGHRGMRGMRWHMMHHQSALSILSERFAKGEINKEEFEEKKKVLLS